MSKKNIKIKAGPLNISGIKIAGGLITGLILAIIFFAVPIVNKKRAAMETEKQENNIITYEQRAYSVTEIQGGNYYIKDGDICYPVAKGLLHSTAAKDTAIAKIADPDNRMVMFTADDVTIPTMYSDSSLIFKAQDGESIPQEFILERFYDNGWTVGARGLTQIAGGNLKTTVTASSFYPGSSISQIQATAGNELIFDKIDGLPFGKDILSSVGTIDGLEQGKNYKLDAYIGTNYVGLDATADTHVYISMERYSLTEYSMDPAGYMKISFPHDLWSGYYYINGLGMFRYINQPKAMGESITNFNTPYFIEKEDGTQEINPANGYGSSMESDSVWNYSIPIQTNSMLDVTVSFEGSLASGRPEAKLVDPDGTEHPLELMTGELNILSEKIEFPKEGNWDLQISNMSGRVFDVAVSFGTPVTGEISVIKEDDKQTEMTVELPEIQDAELTFTWENTDYAGNFLVVKPDGKSFGNSETPDMVKKANYGRVVLHPGYLEDGTYQIYINGKALGTIAFSYEEMGTAAEPPAEGETMPEETTTETKKETDGAEGDA